MLNTGGGVVQGQRTEEKRLVGRAGCAALMIMAFSFGGCSQGVTDCPVPPKQSDVLNVNLFDLPLVSPNDNVRRAIRKIINCKPPHPIFGGPAVISYTDTHIKGPGTFYVRFTVKSLSDISLIYEVNGKGRVGRSFIYGT